MTSRNPSHTVSIRYALLERSMTFRRYHSSAVEGLNNKIRVVTRRSYGFRTYNAMEIALYHNLGRLPEPESPHRFC
jgi:hypothetical protein